MTTLGIVGGGQLGRMLGIAARRLGFGVAILNPAADCPAGDVAGRVYTGAWDDPMTARPFAAAVDAIVFETEHVAPATLNALSLDHVSPQPDIVAIAQDRSREKAFLRSHGFPVIPNLSLEHDTDVLTDGALPQDLTFPAVLKTARGGYDGKGQWLIENRTALAARLKQTTGISFVLESQVQLACEFSVIIARNRSGQVAVYPPFLNDHRDHILDVTVVPAPLDDKLTAPAIDLARQLVTATNYTGLLCIEFFVDNKDRVWVNEIAPRPHNSGHVTIEANATDQFEQTVRAALNLPLGSTDVLRPGAMANILAVIPTRLASVLAVESTTIHVYGKSEARPGRKMAHITSLGATTDEARTRAESARAALLAEET